ncbi:MAG: FemAB family PEP-CTERM system-associated protein [Planctomycetes bacterium]|nr:FemAB family PEP-CTERM system-associated protein [Planctomycetota bacterium]
MSCEIIPYEEGWKDPWDAFVWSHPEGNFSHTRKWSRVVEESLGHVSHSLLAVEEGNIRGILPLHLVQSLLFGRFLVSVPAANTGGVLASDEEAETQMVRKAGELAARLEVAYVEYRQERRATAGLPADTSYVTTRVSLEADPGVLKKRVSYKIRRDLNRAERDGLRVGRGHGRLGEFYALYKAHMRRLGSPPFGRVFFESICRWFGPQADVVVVEQAGRAVAGNLAIHHRDAIYNLYAGAEEEAMKSGAVSLFCWEQMERGCRAGMKVYDLGRSTQGSSTLHYKSYWHGVDVPLSYAYWLHRASEIPNKHADNPRYRLARRVWRILPAPVTDWLGPRLVKVLH